MTLLLPSLFLLLFQVTNPGTTNVGAGVQNPTTAAAPSWTIPNTRVNGACGGASPCTTAAFTSPLTNGSAILACIVGGGSSTHIFSDLAGNTFSDWGPGNVSWNAAAGNFQCAIAPNTHTTASETCSVTDSGFNSQGIVCFEVYAGGSAISVDGGSGIGFISSTGASALTITGGTLTTHTNGNIVILCGTDASFSTRAIGPGTTVITNNSAAAGLLCEYQVVTPAGSNTLTYTQTTGSSFNYVTESVSLK